MSARYSSMRIAGESSEEPGDEPRGTAVPLGAHRPRTQRGLPRVNGATPAPPPPRPRENTAPQAPRMGARLRAVTNPPRETLPLERRPQYSDQTLSYEAQSLFPGLDLQPHRQQTTPLSPADLERLGLRRPESERTTQPNAPVARQAPTPLSARRTQATGHPPQMDTIPDTGPRARVIPLHPHLEPEPGSRPSVHPLARVVDLDLERARHENDPLRQSALLELSGLRTTSPLPWLIAGFSLGLGALALVLALT